MFQATHVATTTMNRLFLSGIEMAQTSIPLNPDPITSDLSRNYFPVPQFLVSLAVGLVIAFALQVLFTNLSVALGISILGDDSSDRDDSESFGHTVRSIETKVGLWALLTVSIALFIACFLAVKLSGVSTGFVGMMIGIVIWAIFFLSLVWVSSTAVGALIGSIAKTAMSGFQGVMGAAKAAIGGNIAKKQAVSTVEDIVASVRKELTGGIEPAMIGAKLKDSLNTLQLPKVDLAQIRQQLEAILSKADLNAIAEVDDLRNVDRQTFVDLIGKNTHLSKQETNQIVDQLEQVWQQTVAKRAKGNPQTALVEFFKSAPREDLRSGKLSDRLKQALAVYQENDSNADRNLLSQALDLGTKTLIPVILSRVDLSDLDVERIVQELQKLTSSAGNSVGQLTAQTFNPSRADLDNYLLQAYPWHFNRETIRQELTKILHDVEADPVRVRQNLEGLNEGYFAQKLVQRGDLQPDLIRTIAQQAEAIRVEVLSTVQTAESEARSQELSQQIESYLQTANLGLLDPETLQRDFEALLDDREVSDQILQQRLARLNFEVIAQRLQQRQSLSDERLNEVIHQLEFVRQQMLAQSKERQHQLQLQTVTLSEKVAAYLRDTGKAELNPEGIKRDFKALLEDPEAGFSRFQDRLGQFDRDTLVKLLSQRQDLSEAEVNQVLDQLESVRNQILQAPAQLTDKAKQQYEKTAQDIAQYLRSTNLEELDPEGIQQDLHRLLTEPKAGALALRDRLSHFDRETLVKLLSQREDLSEAQVNRTVDQVEEAMRRLAKAPRRLASRVQTQVQDFGTSLADYLRNTDKAELNPDGIKRDLQLLLKDPRLGIGNLRDRLSHFDRSTLVALLAQREDISEAEANRIVAQIESTRDSVLEQAHQVQQQVQAAIQSVFVLKDRTSAP
ncbi:MAG: MFS transporter [Aphanocapsa sp. GSE-SYN-MK-11-07L]|jgi:hypothetical protein|nr:MFS transporter [Aphanocapsa sp. GSE-SYN-MK-11-07L]